MARRRAGWGGSATERGARTVAIVLAAACCGSRARAAERDDAIQVLIVSGDTDPAVAKARLAAWSAKHAAAAWTRYALPAGYPRLVASADYPGLKPGFQIGIAGFCRKHDADAVLPEFRLVEGGAYARTVTVGAEALACPARTLARYLAAGYVEIKDERHHGGAASRAMARDVVPGGFPCSRGHLE